AVIGGTRAVWGPALGALIFFLFKNAAGDLTEHWPAIIGGTLIVVTVLLPRGASGTVTMLLERLGARASSANGRWVSKVSSRTEPTSRGTNAPATATATNGIRKRRRSRV